MRFELDSRLPAGDEAAAAAPTTVPDVGVPAAVPRALRDGPYEAVCRAWAAAHTDPADDRRLLATLEDLAAAARRAHVPIAHVLGALNWVGRTNAGRRTDVGRDFHAARAWAGGVVIAAYYRGA